MIVATIPFVIDDREPERQELNLAAAGAARLAGRVSLAWHLRQPDGRRAGELAQQAREMIALPEIEPAQARSSEVGIDLRHRQPVDSRRARSDDLGSEQDGL